MKQALSIEQMKHLQEFGLDTSDASMCLEWNESDSDNMVVTSMDADTNYDYYYETYTLQDIINKLPCFIGDEVLTIQKLADSYTCLYMNPYTRSFINITEGEELIDAVYDMLCWCIENGYVKVEEKLK
jgi:hypothetical protein